MILGIDAGTQSLKAVLVRPDHSLAGSHAVAYQPEFPKAGWAEQHPAIWERALAPAIAGALAAAGASARAVQALGLTGQLDGCIAVDAAGEPLHPCLIWMDRRAAAEVQGLDADLVRRRAGVVLDATHLAAKMRWLKRHVPAARAARCFHGPVSYLVQRLTGVAVIDHATASTSMLYGLEGRDYDPELLEHFGLTAAELPRPAPAESLAGVLTARGAARTGLTAGLPVAVGTGDDFASALGAGLTRPGTLMNVLGTAEVVGALSAAPLIDRLGLVETHAWPGGLFYIENPGWLCGGAVTWFCRTFSVASAADLSRLAATVPAGAEGVIFLPALSGAMAPEWIASARGGFHGLSPVHTTAHLARAVLEGTAFAMRDVLERLTGMGLGITAIRLAGGGARSALWPQIRADLTGLPVEIPAHTDTSPMGAALLAGVASGIWSDVGLPPDSAMRHFTPDGRQAEAYDSAYRRYRALFQALKPLF